MRVQRVNWIAIAELTEPLRVTVKIRSRAEEAGATLTAEADGSVLVTFDEAQRAVTPGQAAVFYDGDRCLGGASIFAALRASGTPAGTTSGTRAPQAPISKATA